MSENRTVIDEIYKAFGDREYETVLGHFADDFVWNAADNSPLADQSPYRGVDAVRKGVFERIAAGFESLRIEADEIFEAGDRVVVLGYYHGQFRGKADDFRAQVAHIWTIQGGKAVNFQQYVDTLQIARCASAQ